MAFTVFDVLNEKSKAGTEDIPQARFRVKDISIFKMYRNEKNFYSTELIEELAGEILMYGLKQNLELVYEPCEKGEYRIIAGERRWMALKMLVEKGYKDFEIATCKLTAPQDSDEEQIEIIIANAYRTKSVADMIEEEKRLKDALGRMKSEGKKIRGYDLESGRLRDVIAAMLKMSRTKVAQIESVNNNLISEFKEELKKERMTFSAAYEISGMTETEQKEVLEKYKESGGISYKDIKNMKDQDNKEGAKAGKENVEIENGIESKEAYQYLETEYQEPHPESILSLCYSCKEYSSCDAKTATCAKCDRYINKAESEKTEEQRYSEEQDSIDRRTKKRLNEQEDERKMECLPGMAAERDGNAKKYIRVPEEIFRSIESGRQSYLILKDDNYREGNKITAVEFAKGKTTGQTLDIIILNREDENSSSALEPGYCIIGIRRENVTEREQPELPHLKNNEQRKEWIQNVEAWGLWYEDENIQARYYRYIFPDGSRLIAAKYRYTCPPWLSDDEDFIKDDGNYRETYYHMIYSDEYAANKENKYKCYERYYTNTTTSVAEIEEYLKLIQKKD